MFQFYNFAIIINQHKKIMESYLPSNSINVELSKQNNNNYELNRLRDANLNFKLQIIDLKLKLNAIKEVFKTKTNN